LCHNHDGRQNHGTSWRLWNLGYDRDLAVSIKVPKLLAMLCEPSEGHLSLRLRLHGMVVGRISAVEPVTSEPDTIRHEGGMIFRHWLQVLQVIFLSSVLPRFRLRLLQPRHLHDLLLLYSIDLSYYIDLLSLDDDDDGLILVETIAYLEI
jgi:hypothetical protein